MLNIPRKLLAVLYLTLLTNTASLSTSEDNFSKQVIISQMKPFLEAIEAADAPIHLGAYKLHEHLLPNPDIMKSLRDLMTEKPEASDQTFIILESNLTKEEQKEAETPIQAGDSLNHFQGLKGAKLIESSPRYNATHYKVLCSKDYALVGTTNFDKNFDQDDVITRDFSCVITEPKLIKSIRDIFTADQNNQDAPMQQYRVADLNPGETQLTWGPDQHRLHLQQLIESATDSIYVYQQALQDEAITALLVQAIERGIKVWVLMSKFPFGPKHGNKSADNQAKVHSAHSRDNIGFGEVRLTGHRLQTGELAGKSLHIHAKVVLIDADAPEKATMYLGSANFYAPALDKDRNVGLITRDPDYITPVFQQFQKDWAAHKPT